LLARALRFARANVGRRTVCVVVLEKARIAWWPSPRNIGRVGHSAKLAILLFVGLVGCKGKTERATGPEIYANACSRCHGREGGGGTTLAGPAPRNFRDPAFQRARTDEELKTAIRAGKGAMPAFGAVFDEVDLAALVQHLRSFDPEKKAASR
jgi:cytochrome c553